MYTFFQNRKIRKMTGRKARNDLKGIELAKINSIDYGFMVFRKIKKYRKNNWN